jgi:hypothetical protein
MRLKPKAGDSGGDQKSSQYGRIRLSDSIPGSRRVEIRM